ncbi:MobA/MobL family protein, partial [Collinsella sp. CLA-ER-H2]
MAIFHLNYRGCSPATGAGAVRKAAYQSGQALVEERTGQLCDYARKERVVEEGLSLPGGVPPIGRGELWNGAERAWAEGGGGNELVALRYEFALPIELDADGRRACVRDFCGMFPAKACDWAIHDDGRGGNPHAHVLVSALDLGAQGFIQRTKGEKGQCWYLCQDAHGQQAPMCATDWKAAKADGWEKIYNFKDGRRLTMKQAKAEGLGTKDRTSKRPVQMH